MTQHSLANGKLLVEHDGSITILTINRPQRRNALDNETALAITQALRQFDQDDGAEVAILTGAGGSFCAGADLKALAEGEMYPPWGADPDGPCHDLLGKPLIAAVEGYACAGGLGLALRCDLRVAAEGACFAVLSRRWGVPMSDGTTVRLPRLIGRGRALDMLMSARQVGAQEACAMGLADRLAPRGQALAQARQLARLIASFPRRALLADRTSLYAALDRPLAEALQEEARLSAAARAADATSGARRFADGAGRHGSLPATAPPASGPATHIPPPRREIRAVVCRQLGHYSKMEVATLAAPTPGPGEVCIEVQAAGVSFANLLVVAGRHQNRAEPPFVPGTEIAGVVVSCGDGVSQFTPGQRVMAAVPRGGFAEQVIARADITFAIPDQMSFAEATLFPTLYGTAHISLVSEARLKAGETLLVHGAAGGTGLAAVQIGKALGANVIACASTAEKRAVAMEAGAAQTVDSRTFRQQVLELTAGRGADVVFDPVGGAVFEESLRCAAPGGRLLVIGFASGNIPQIPANLLLVKNISAIGVYWGYYLGWARKPPGTQAREALADCFQSLFRLYRDGQLKPQVQAVFPFTAFRDALSIVEQRQAIGKVVLTPDRL